MHAVFEVLNDIVVIAANDVTNGFNILVVFFFIEESDAWPQTVSNVVFQTNFEFLSFDVGFAQLVCTRAKWIKLFYQFQQRMHRFYRGIRPKVLRSILNDLSGGINTRKTLVFDDDGRIRFIVFQRYVVSRLVLFNEVVLKQQSIQLSVDNDEFDVGYFPHQYPCLPVFVFDFREIRRNTLFQRLGFSDIQQRTFTVVILINTGLIRQSLKDVFDMF